MSRHHMLPPIIYLRELKPKKIESRKSRIQLRSTGKIKDTGEVEEVEETGLGQPTPISNKPPLELIEESDRKPKSTTGHLSEGTLKAMLAAQEEVK
jgi:hypothetical protein